MTTRNGGELQVRAAGIDDGEHTVLFAGIDGAGKTTMARLWKAHSDARVLSDDQNLIHLFEGRPFVCAQPASLHDDPLTVCGAPLAALFFLQQSTRNCVVPVSAEAAAAELADRVLDEESDDDDDVMAAAERVTSRVPCFRLWFRDDAAALAAVREALG